MAGSDAERIRGRNAEVGFLRSLAADVAQGGRAMVVVVGDAGIGKSLLVAEAAKEAARLGLATGLCRCDPLAQLLPFAPLLDLLGPLEPVEPERTDAAGDRRAFVVEQLLGAVEARAGDTGLLLVVDDLQWSDAETLLTLRVLVRRLTGVPLGLVVAMRRHPRSVALEALLAAVADDGGETIELGPLGPSAVAEVIEDLAGATPSAALSEWGRRAQGNPFMLVELVRGFVDQGAVSLDSGVATVSGEDIPASFVDLLRSRLAILPVDVRELLTTASVLGTEFRSEDLAAVVGAPVTAVLATVSDAVANGILISDDAGLRFRHELIREAIYADIPVGLRPTLHLEIATALLEAGSPPIDVAPYLIAGAQKGDLRAADLLRQASAAAALRAPGPAADLLLHAIDVLPDGSPDRPELLAQVVRLLIWAGRPADGERRAREELAGGRGSAGAALRAELVHSLMVQGRATSVIEEAGMETVRPGFPGNARALIVAAEANARLFVGSLDDAEAAGRSAVELGRRHDEPGAVCLGLIALSCAARFRGFLDDSLALIEEATADADNPEVRTREPELFRVRTLAALDRLADADSVARAGQRAAEELGLSWSISEWHMLRSTVLVDLGRWDEAAAEAEAGLAVADEMNTWSMVQFGIAALAEVALRRGDLATSRSWIRRGRELADAGVGFTAEFLSWATALVEDATDNSEAALELLRPMYAGLSGRATVIVQSPAAGPWLVRLALRCDEQALAQLAAQVTERLAAANPAVVSLRAAAEHSAGLIAGDAQRLVNAAESYRESPRPLARASACEDAGTALAESRASADAVRYLEQARRIYQDVGATWDEARVDDRLRRLGIRGRGGASRARPRTGWESLTPAERSVADLVAQGLTNRAVAGQLFISRHTVDSHLRHIFDKLDLRSRVELAAFVARRNG